MLQMPSKTSLTVPFLVREIILMQLIKILPAKPKLNFITLYFNEF